MNKSLFGSNIVYVLNISLLLHLDLVSINQIIDTSKAGYFSERRSEGSWLLVDRLSWVWWCSCHSVFETRILRKLSDVRSWNYIIALIGSNYFERPERTNSRDDVWAARQDTWTRYCSRVVMASRERDVVAVRRWRWLRDKLRHVYRAIKYMSGKSLSCYRSEVSFSSWAREGRLRRKKSERNGGRRGNSRNYLSADEESAIRRPDQSTVCCRTLNVVFGPTEKSRQESRIVV